MTDSYLLYIHEPESDDDIDADIYEPAAFQIPLDMCWDDLQDMICKEVGTDKMTFSYIDDEKERVRIDTQEEYEIALDIRKFEGGRDLHIYATRSTPRPLHRRKRRMEQEMKKQKESEALPAPVLREEEDEMEIYRPPVEEPQQQEEAASAAVVSEPEEAAIAPPPQYSEEAMEAQEATVSSTVPEEGEETIPMPVVGIPIVNIIKKEVKEAVQRELDEMWEYVNLFKKDVNEKLDTIGEHLASETQGEETTQKALTAPVEGPEDISEKQPRAKDQTTEQKSSEDTNNFAASFICESLLDGSVVHTGATFQKYWVFRNEGAATWDDSTKLHLLEETCTPAVSSGSSLSEWGAKKKSVSIPSLRHGETGVVCAEHAAPAHRCSYNSSWRLSHKSNAFGPRVWCNVRVVDESSPFSSPSGYDLAKNLGSFEMVDDRKSTEEKKQTCEEELNDSLVPPEKVQVEVKTPKQDDTHNDHSIMSFNMTDISEATKYIQNERQEAEPYNPAVTSVEPEKEERLHASLKEENSTCEGPPEKSPESPVMVEAEDAIEEEEQEEPRTLEGPGSQDDGEDARPESEQQANDENHVENFTTPVMHTPDPGSSSDEEEEEEEPLQEEVQETEDVRQRHASSHSSEDLHSVDFNLDDAASMASYVSDFVVVPLPECFDVNRPLNVPEQEAEEEKQPVVESQDAHVEMPPADITMEDPMANYPPSDSDSDEDINSQPNSTTHIKEYKSEDSLPVAPKSPVAPSSPTPTSPESPTQRGNLAPNFVPPFDNSVADQMERQPGSLMNESLNSAISQNFQAFTTNPKSPTPPEPQKVKIPMNQMPGAKPKIPLYEPQPLPVPPSVVAQDKPYNLEQETPYFPPFEQGWRRNPIPLPNSVLDETPWTPPQAATTLPKSEFTLNRNSSGIESTLPSHPFATTQSRDTSLQDPPLGGARQRSVSPDIELAEQFYPPGLESVPGANLHQLDQEPEDDFRTPPPSPPPMSAIEPSALDHLYEMGFHDMDLNRDMFERCGNDINRTVQALVLRMEADEEDVTMNELERRVLED